MLDLSRNQRKPRVRTPRILKLIIVLLPWLFVGYGLNILKEYLAFYNNSVATLAVVTSEAPSDRAVPSAVEDGDRNGVGILTIPAFRYRHENGLTFVGGPLVTPFYWQYEEGEEVEIRYNRLHPGEAQPVSFFRFWWHPTLFILGGAVSSGVFAVASGLLTRPQRPRYRARQGTLQLRRD